MSTNGAHHTGVTVTDLDRAIDFYTRQLGCTVEKRFSVSGEAIGTAMDSEGMSGTFVHLDSASLTRPTATHLAFSVDDIDAFVDGLSDHVELLNEPQTTESGTRLIFVRDPDGTLVELLEA